MNSNYIDYKKLNSKRRIWKADYTLITPDIYQITLASLRREQIIRVVKYVEYFNLGKKVTRLSKQSNLDIIEFCESILFDKYYMPYWEVNPHIILKPFFKFNEWEDYLTYSEFLNRIELIYTKRPTRFWD